MDLRYRLYPHPVLISDTDDYINSSFDFELNVTHGIKELIFNFSLHLINDEMKALIAKGELEYLIHLECSLTSYREVIKSSSDCFTKRISESNLNGKISVCAFVVAKKDLVNYCNKSFNEDYEGMSFSIERGSIVAIGGQRDINIIKEAEELTKIPSIFSIIYVVDMEKSMEIALDSEKIIIHLPETAFQNYKILCNMPNLLPALHSMIIVPALIFVLETLKKEGIENYEYRRWFAAIKKALAKGNVILDENTLDNIPSYELAQKLLDSPLNRALSAMTTFDDSEDEI